MTDRLTQLQICLDQLVEQFSATLNYVTSEESTPGHVPEPPAASPSKRGDSPPEARPAPPPEPTATATIQQEEDFRNNVTELSTDLILKTRQIITLIDSLPGIGVSPQEQLQKIESLQAKLNLAEQERVGKLKQTTELLEWCEEVIIQVAGDMAC